MVASAGETEESVILGGGFDQSEVCKDFVKEGEEGVGGTRGRSGIEGFCDEIEVTTEESGETVVDFEKGFADRGLSGFLILSCVEVGVDDLEGGVPRVGVLWVVRTTENITVEGGRKKEVVDGVGFEEGGTVDHGNPGDVVLGGTEGHFAPRERVGKREFFIACQTGLLKTDDVVCGGKRTESFKNVTVSSTALFGGVIVREIVDIEGGDPGDEEDRVLKPD